MPQLSSSARAILAEHPDSTVAELARLTGIHPTIAHGILPKLDRHGLAIRRRGRRGPGGGPDRWRLADGVVARRPPNRRLGGDPDQAGSSASTRTSTRPSSPTSTPWKPGPAGC